MPPLAPSFYGKQIGKIDGQLRLNSIRFLCFYFSQRRKMFIFSHFFVRTPFAAHCIQIITFFNERNAIVTFKPVVKLLSLS